MAGKSQLDKPTKTLEQMAQEANALVVASKRDYIAGLSLAELETIALEVLSEALQAINPSTEPELAMKLANATLDRSRGKPAQALSTTINGNITNTIQIIRFSDLPAPVDNPKLPSVYNHQVIDNKQ